MPALLARHCVQCELRHEEPLELCGACAADLPWNEHPCARCAAPLSDHQQIVCRRCEQQPPSFVKAYAPLLYQDGPAEWVQALKFSHNVRAGTVLAHLLLRHCLAHRVEADVVVPVPLSTRKLKRRGHNQSTLLARRVAQGLRSRLSLSLLKKIRHTPEQVGLTRRQRASNLRGAFRASGQAASLAIALVDDVMTSGATARAASDALLDAGARTVIVLCPTRTPPG